MLLQPSKCDSPVPRLHQIPTPPIPRIREGIPSTRLLHPPTTIRYACNFLPIVCRILERCINLRFENFRFQNRDSKKIILPSEVMMNLKTLEIKDRTHNISWIFYDLFYILKFQITVIPLSDDAGEQKVRRQSHPTEKQPSTTRQSAFSAFTAVPPKTVPLRELPAPIRLSIQDTPSVIRNPTDPLAPPLNLQVHIRVLQKNILQFWPQVSRKNRSSSARIYLSAL